MGALQGMTPGGVATAVGPDQGTQGGSIIEAVSLKTDAGQALAVAGVGILILALTVGRREGSIVGKAGAVVEWIVIVAAAMLVVNYGARTYVGLNPDGPLAGGVRFDA